MNILITGACGHIGSYLSHNINKIHKIKKVILVDNLKSNRYNSIFNLPKKIKRAVNREFSKFDKTMRKVLREEQTEAWGAYMAAFKTTMNDIMASRMRR